MSPTASADSPKHPSFAGILLQEYDADGRQAGRPGRRTSFAGSALGLVEGPHLFKRNGWYYLTTAEGGTGYEHAVTMARSRTIDGPYELHPDIHLITSKDAPEAPLQRAGHGQIVETPDGEVYHTHLCSRPLPGMRRSPLGRETAIQKCVWGDDGWLRLAEGGPVPACRCRRRRRARAKRDAARESASATILRRANLPLDFQWLRTPLSRAAVLAADEPGACGSMGARSIGSWYDQALVARRQEHLSFRAETESMFSPPTFQQAAGLAITTTVTNSISWPSPATSDQGPRADNHELPRRLAGRQARLPAGRADRRFQATAPVRLAVEVDGAALQFFYRNGERWNLVGPVLDASVISDEGGRGEHGSFTGAFVGMAAFDTSGAGLPADFDYFSYENRDP